jgi:preprotein translocase subunit SecG
MHSVIIVIHLMIVAALIGVVLLQKSEGGGLGIGSGGGGGGGFMTGRGTANLLTRTTAFLAVGFFITSMFLSWLATYNRGPSSLLPTGAPATQQGAPSSPLTAPTSGGLLDSLKKADEQQAPSAPQAPQSR